MQLQVWRHSRSRSCTSSHSSGSIVMPSCSTVRHRRIRQPRHLTLTRTRTLIEIALPPPPTRCFCHFPFQETTTLCKRSLYNLTTHPWQQNVQLDMAATMQAQRLGCTLAPDPNPNSNLNPSSPRTLTLTSATPSSSPLSLHLSLHPSLLTPATSFLTLLLLQQSRGSSLECILLSATTSISHSYPRP